MFTKAQKQFDVAYKIARRAFIEGKITKADFRLWLKITTERTAQAAEREINLEEGQVKKQLSRMSVADIAILKLFKDEDEK